MGAYVFYVLGIYVFLLFLSRPVSVGTLVVVTVLVDDIVLLSVSDPESEFKSSRWPLHASLDKENPSGGGW